MLSPAVASGLPGDPSRHSSASGLSRAPPQSVQAV